MRKLSKFTLEEYETISNDEMKTVCAGLTPRDISFYECFVDGSDVPNDGQKCIYAQTSSNTIITGTCRKRVSVVVEYGMPRYVTEANCVID